MQPSTFVAMFVPYLPGLLVSLVALLLAAVRFRVHPGISIATMVAFLAHLGGIGLSLAYQGWMLTAASRGISSEQVVAPSVIVAAVNTTLDLLFLVLVTAAIFMGRRKQVPPTSVTA